MPPTVLYPLYIRKYIPDSPHGRTRASDVDITTLVETDIKILPESRELDIAIVTLDGDGHFLT